MKKKRLILVIVKFLEWNMKYHGNMYLKAICGGGGGGGIGGGGGQGGGWGGGGGGGGGGVLVFILFTVWAVYWSSWRGGFGVYRLLYL